MHGGVEAVFLASAMVVSRCAMEFLLTGEAIFLAPLLGHWSQHLVPHDATARRPSYPLLPTSHPTTSSDFD